MLSNEKMRQWLYKPNHFAIALLQECGGGSGDGGGDSDRQGLK